MASDAFRIELLRPPVPMAAACWHAATSSCETSSASLSSRLLVEGLRGGGRLIIEAPAGSENLPVWLLLLLLLVLLLLMLEPVGDGAAGLVRAAPGTGSHKMLLFSAGLSGGVARQKASCMTRSPVLLTVVSAEGVGVGVARPGSSSSAECAAVAASKLGRAGSAGAEGPSRSSKRCMQLRA